ncbi:MAG: hypothetical protein L6R37_007325 [Teloschistes peruensis]|nr:MAG: hypothetical protein L6R37_007325 [Teloschistes peruensis]
MGPPATGPPAATTLAVKSDEPWTENLTMRVICKDCKEDPPNVVEDFAAGDMICGSCGLVLGDRIVDTRSEWRTFTNDDQNNDDPSRVGDGANPLLNGAQLQTAIAFGGGAAAKSRDLSRAQNKVNNDKSTKTLLAAYKQIGAFCDGMSTSKNVSDTSKHLFKIVHDESAFRGKSQDSLIAACIFIACRQCKVARTFREVQDVTKVSKAEIGRAFKYLEKFFAARNEKMKAAVVEAGGVFNPDGSGYDNVESTTPKDLCTRFCNLLDLSQKCTRLSQDVAAKTEMSGILAGRSPISTAAACIYMASYLAGEPKSAKDVAIVAGVSDGTIRNAYKIMFGEKEKLIRKDWTAQGKVDLKRLPPA